MRPTPPVSIGFAISSVDHFRNTYRCHSFTPLPLEASAWNGRLIRMNITLDIDLADHTANLHELNLSSDEDRKRD